MNATILHESRGRIRFRLRQKQMTLAQADLLEAWLQGKSWCRQVTVHERTCCVILYYDGTRQAVLNEIRHFSWQEAEQTTALPAHSSRALNREFEEKLVAKVVCKAACTLFLPPPLRLARILWHMVPFVRRGLGCLLRRRIKVELLDALSISISACRRDFGTAGMVMFLLEVGELLEEWTRKKSVADLARCMSLNVDRVWLRTAQGEVLVPVSQIQPGDAVVVRAGGIVPVDGLVLEGEVTVNQASLTGESIPVPKRPGGAVYAGTVVEEGECVLEVKQASGQSRYDQIVHMIEQSEQMKSEAESKAANLADKLVPYTFIGSLLSFVLTRNVARALSVLMVDFSCALKLAMPLAVLSAMREAGRAHITVKGGKFLEAVAAADTIVFDKTGTLTRACPRVAQVVSFGGKEEAEMLRLAACLEEHFPHSMANAVVEEAKRRGLRHEEYHSKVEYLVAHGIASTVDEEQVLIGSAHFVFEDEGCVIPEGEQERFDALPPEYSHLYLAVGGQLAAVICISDRAAGRRRRKLLVHPPCSGGSPIPSCSPATVTAPPQPLPPRWEWMTSALESFSADKAEYVARLRRKGHTRPDGGRRHQRLTGPYPRRTRASPSATAPAIAREIADITIAADSLWELVELRRIAMALMARIHSNYRFVIGFNGALIALGVAGVLPPATLRHAAQPSPLWESVCGA